MIPVYKPSLSVDGVTGEEPHEPSGCQRQVWHTVFLALVFVFAHVRLLGKSFLRVFLSLLLPKALRGFIVLP